MARSSTSFKPGVSGNPGGRPREIGQVRELARLRTEEAIDVLSTIMNDKDAPPAARCRASEALLDRGWGRAGQPVDLAVDDSREPPEVLAYLEGVIAANKSGDDTDDDSTH